MVTTSVAATFLIGMCLANPEIQKKIQEEVDEVLGDRVPTLKDRPHLPYLEAVTLELLRRTS